MNGSSGPRVIALEEHYWDPDLLALFPGSEGKRVPEVAKRMLDMGELRLREMDEAGIDMQVLSHGAPGTQKLDAATSVRMARQTNDRLAAFVATNPKRFAALCLLPTPDPAAAADELERAVSKLGMKGAMIHGLTNGKFIDEPNFWPIFERAQALDVPIYLHPAFPSPVVTDAYYKEYTATNPLLIGPALGFTVEALTQGVRMVISGVFEKYPKLKIILGHLGEGIPFLLWRIDNFLPRSTGSSFKDIFRKNFYLTTSGFFSDTALTASITEMGIDHVMFSVDWPFNNNKAGTDWLNSLPLSATDRAKMAGGTAKALLKL
ncbi:amidohydrolase family protein [Rhodoplanes sp. Z2-YC6860]|uniref:amidohydrolase family protein n=1 Tax=Rhodoplanes sp. Z2-YC6860 TaxID=674703 RepID=UPI00078D3D55|nr:amidohydrolase family protein [Rhodoplanes sp. Z2-YC6860]AMN43179.1 amidohydrolase 2 [Rhodoplanes sp. Z2-YC6860]